MDIISTTLFWFWRHDLNTYIIIRKKNVALVKNRVIQEGKSFKSNNEWYI